MRADLLLPNALRLLFLFYCALVFVFLVAPLLAIMPLSFNSEPFFTYPLPGLSLRWYQDFFSSPVWQLALKNSIIVGFFATLIATALGTAASIGLSRRDCPWKTAMLAVLISPMIVPIVVAAAGVYFFFAEIGLLNTLTGLIFAHAALGAPFVVITVSATLAGFDTALMRAAGGLGATPSVAFRRVMLPLILPGVVSGALFAFVTSFDDVVFALFLTGSEQRTLPRQMFSGIREQISPTITAVATLLTGFAVLLLICTRALQRRSEKMRAPIEA
jgi:putative spermidine/putrescine transport system permease protein